MAKPFHQFIVVLILSACTFHTLYFGLSSTGVFIRPLWWFALAGNVITTLSDLYIIVSKPPRELHPNIAFVLDNTSWCLTLNLFYFVICYLNLTVAPQELLEN